MISNLSKKGVWGLYIEETGITAVKVSRKDKRAIIEAFDTIRYAELPSNSTGKIETEPKIRFKSTPATDYNQDANITTLVKLVEEAITVFLNRNRLEVSDKILTALPSRFVLSRFVNLPPVGKKRLKEIVRYETEKHIPLEVKEIIWDFHSFSPDKAEPGKAVEVGIFAIKKEDVYAFLSCLKAVKEHLTTVQIGAIALYNFLIFDGQITAPTILIEIGNNNTNLMIIDNTRLWIRNIPSGELDSNLVDEVKRSVGYYKSLVKEIVLKHLIVLGDTHIEEEKKKSISGQLECELKDITLPKNIGISSTVDKERFISKPSSLGIPLGLAIQGLSLEKISVNLIPEDVARKVAIIGKKKTVLYSSIIIFFGVLTLYLSQQIQDKRLSSYANSGLDILNNIVNLENVYKGKEKTYKDKLNAIHQITTLGEGRTFWIKIIPKILDTIPEEVILYSLKAASGYRPNQPTMVIEMSIKGKSLNPRLGFIDEMIKSPLEKMTLRDKEDKEIPLFEEVGIVPGSIQDVRDGINFEIRWIVKHDSLLLISSMDSKETLAPAGDLDRPKD